MTKPRYRWINDCWWPVWFLRRVDTAMKRAVELDAETLNVGAPKTQEVA